MDGVTLRPLIAYRDKAIGCMASSGEYTVGDCVLNDDSHYTYFPNVTERHWSLKFYKGKDAYWHLGIDDDGQIWFSSIGFFNNDIQTLKDWEKTPFKFDK